ncbi:MAG: hypothetical protein NZ744_08355, partial [Pirellulaceae bacterium]|nr:hypothetical protein [Pirellulaceae bacterium]
LNNLDNIDSSYDRRKAIDELDQDVTYSVSVVIDKIAENYSYVREDGYRDAYYITGDVSDSEHRVKVLLPTSMNSEVQSWNEGETKVIEATISDWDLAYKQFGLLGRSVIISETEVAESTLDPAVEAPSEGVTQQDDVVEVEADIEEPESVEPAEEPVDVAAVIEEPESVEPAEEPVEVAAVTEEPESVEPAEEPVVEPIEEPVDVVEVETDIEEPEDPAEATPENQEVENFLEQMESPTPLEQLAEEYADAEPSDWEDKAPIPTAIPVLEDVPTLKNVPTRATVQPRQAKRFSNHAPVRPARILNKAQEDESQERTTKIIKITVGIAVGIMLLMCLCCGMLSLPSG